MKTPIFLLALITAVLTCRANDDATKQSDVMSAFAPITLLDTDLDFWFKVPPNSAFIPRISKVYKNEEFLYLPMVKNIAKSDNYAFRGKYKISLRKIPDGKINTHAENEFDGRIVNKTDLFLLDPTAVFAFEDTDELGKYELIFEFENLTNKTSAKASTEVELVQWKTPSPIEDPKELSKAMKNFNTNYSPELLYAALTSPLLSFRQETGVNFSSYYFFLKALEKHDFLLKILSENFDKMRGTPRFNALVIMAALGAEKSAKGATPTEIETAKIFNSTTETRSAADRLDSYWGEFFATGRAKPLYDVICEMFKHRKSGNNLMKKLSENNDDISEQELIDAVPFCVAMWSLRSICSSNDLAAQYFQTYVSNLNDAEKTEFVSAFKEAEALYKKLK